MTRGIQIVCPQWKPTHGFSSSLALHLERENLERERERETLPLDCTKVFAQGKQSSKNATYCRHSQPHRVAQEQLQKIAARGKTSKAIPAFMATIGLQMCEATLNTACSKIEEVRLSWFVHQNGRVQAVHFNSPIRLHWCYHGSQTTDTW